MSSSAENDILVKFLDSLHGSISNSILSLSFKATSANLLTSEEQEKCTIPILTPSQQFNQFMHFITHKVNSDPSTLTVFITEVIGSEPSFSKLAHEMRKLQTSSANSVRMEIVHALEVYLSLLTGIVFHIYPWPQKSFILALCFYILSAAL